MEKINIAELLKDCPKGTELYSPLVGDCKFVKVHDYESQIIVKLETGATVAFLSDGRYFDYSNAECMLFPSKDKTAWKGFHRPFVEGDIVTWQDRGSLVACIYKERKNTTSFYHHIALYNGGIGIILDGEIVLTDDELCFATEEEKAKLFQVIKDNGYKWNEETKTLEKLTPNKFDITTLKPFDKVLVRDNNTQKWTADLFSFYDRSLVYPYSCVGHYTNQCVPFESNKHLLGTTDDCDEYFKTWEI